MSFSTWDPTAKDRQRSNHPLGNIQVPIFAVWALRRYRLYTISTTVKNEGLLVSSHDLRDSPSTAVKPGGIAPRMGIAPCNMSRTSLLLLPTQCHTSAYCCTSITIAIAELVYTLKDQLHSG